MKRLALINTYCNNWERIQILQDNIIKLKELGIDSLVYSPIPLPKEISELADYTIISKENPIIQWPVKAMAKWRRVGNKKLNNVTPDYGWASIYQYKKLLQFGLTLDYDHYFGLIYDLIFSKEVVDTFQTPHPKLFFPSPKAQSSKVGNNFFSLDKENAFKVIPLLTKDTYLGKTRKAIAEKHMEYICEVIDGEISTHLTDDLIHEHELFTKWELNSSHTIRLFIQNENSLELYLESNIAEDVVVKINDTEHKLNLNPIMFLSSDIKLEEVKNISITCKGQTLDLIKHLKPHNLNNNRIINL